MLGSPVAAAEEVMVRTFRLYGPLQPWFDQTWTLNDSSLSNRTPVGRPLSSA
jgi:hypothetical protein